MFPRPCHIFIAFSHSGSSLFAMRFHICVAIPFGLLSHPLIRICRSTFAVPYRRFIFAVPYFLFHNFWFIFSVPYFLFHNFCFLFPLSYFPIFAVSYLPVHIQSFRIWMRLHDSKSGVNHEGGKSVVRHKGEIMKWAPERKIRVAAPGKTRPE